MSGLRSPARTDPGGTARRLCSALPVLVALLLAGTAAAAETVEPAGHPAEGASARVPLVVVPDHMGSVPPMKHAAAFPFRRGMPPEALQLSADYDALLAALERSGYRRDLDLFPVPWDWRMALAPDDGALDGRLDGFRPALERRDLATAAGYLGAALARVAAARPEAREVDVVAHGAGGLLVRALLQSDAAPSAAAAPSVAATPSAVAPSVTAESAAAPALPRVRRLVLVGVPFQGVASAWNAWHGNFADIGAAREVARKVFPIAFQAVRSGQAIPGPDRTIDRRSIQAGKDGKTPDPTRFYRLYDAGARALLPTDPFLVRRDGARPIARGPASNRLLLDLDAASPGALAWLDGVERSAVTHGAGLPTIVAMRRRRGPDRRDPEAGRILLLPRLQSGEMIAPKEEEIWFAPVVDPVGGDGVVSARSLRPEVASDPRVAYRVWAPRSAAVAGATATDGPVGHVEILANPDVLAWIVQQLATDAPADQPSPH